MDNSRKWATVSLEDGMIFEGIIEVEAPYGVYFHIAGDENRLCLWPWHVISRITYKVT